MANRNQSKHINNQKQNKNQKKHLFGRNPFTFFVVLFGAVLIFFMVYIPYSYISTKAKANPIPFDTNVTDTMKTNVGVKTSTATTTTTTTATSGSITSTSTGPKMTDDAEIMKGSEFKDLNIKFYAETYDDLDSGNATFHLELQWNKKTGEMIKSMKMNQLSSNGYTVYAYVCLSAPWVLADDKPFANYSSLQSYTIKAPDPSEVYTSLKDTDKTFDPNAKYYTMNSETKAYEVAEVTAETFEELKPTLYSITYVYEGTSQSKTVSVSGLKNFPYKTKLWTDTFPTRVSVDAPTAYVYIYFKYQDENDKIITKRYILSYEYNEYHTDKTKGGINYDK